MKSETIMIRISEQEKTLWKAAADQRGMTLSEYIRYIVTRETEKSDR